MGYVFLFARWQHHFAAGELTDAHTHKQTSGQSQVALCNVQYKNEMFLSSDEPI